MKPLEGQKEEIDIQFVSDPPRHQPKVKVAWLSFELYLFSPP
jgi:hypothetical protein